MSEPSVFLDATLPRANERERILVDFRAATLPLPCGHAPNPLSPGRWLPNCELEWDLALAARTQSPACLHPLHPVETCQAASPKALHLFERMLERKCIAYHLPPSVGVFIVIGDHFGPHGCGFRTHSLCSYVKQLWEKINRRGRFSLSDGRRREVGLWRAGVAYSGSALAVCWFFSPWSLARRNLEALASGGWALRHHVQQAV